MQNSTDLKNIENYVFSIKNDKNYNSMMVSANEIYMMGKRTNDPAEFWKAKEEKSMFNSIHTFETDKIKHIICETDEIKANIKYTKMMITSPGAFDFNNKEDLDSFLFYAEKKWEMRRTEQTLSPWKATLPYFGGLVATIGCTLTVLYFNIYGGSGRINVFILLLIKLGEKIGIIGTLLLGLVISYFVVKGLIGAFKNPPVETKLEAKFI
jgi:hypothetical protein